MLYTFPKYNVSIEADSLEDAVKKLHNSTKNEPERPDKQDTPPLKSKKVSRNH